MICFLLFSTSAVQQNFIVKHGRHSIVTWQFVRIWFTRTMVKIDVGIAKGEKKSTLTLEYLITLRHLSNVHSVHIGKLSFIWQFDAVKLMVNSINFNAQHVNGMTHFDLDFCGKRVNVRLLDTLNLLIRILFRPHRHYKI